MFENIDEEFRVSLLSCIEYLRKYNVKYLSSSVLILSFIHFEDSLFNEICGNISFDEVFEIIVNEKIYKDDLQDILEEAANLSKTSGSKIIYDEYIFYACLKLDCAASALLEKIGLDVEKIKLDIMGYITSDNPFLTNLTKLASEGKLTPFIGRASFINKIIRVLSKKQKCNCMLIGNAGVGKSALVEGVALELYKRKSDVNIYRLDLGVIIAGTRYRGDLEERLMEVIDLIKESNAVLFIDEIHTIVSSGNSEGSLDIANILKPALARNEIKCIGATTTDEYYKYIEKDKALERRFERVFIPEASKEETYKILRGISGDFSSYYSVKYSDRILREIIDSCKFFPNKRFPDKAIDLMDEVGSFVKEKGRVNITNEDIRKVVFENIGILEEKLKDIKLNFEELRLYYASFFMGLDIREMILSCLIKEENVDYLLDDLEKVFLITRESVLFTDIYSNKFYEEIYDHVMKNPIGVIVMNYDKNAVDEFINEYINNNKNRKISFKNTVIIFTFESKKRGFCERIGYNNDDEFLSLKDKYIDEVLDVKKRYCDKIINFQNSLNKRKKRLILDGEFSDSDYENVTKIVMKNINKDLIILRKENEGNIVLEKNNVVDCK